MLKNLSKATGFDCNTRARILFVNAFLTKGWQATLMGCKVSLEVLFSAHLPCKM
jgi:hypothetical protein